METNPVPDEAPSEDPGTDDDDIGTPGEDEAPTGP